MMNEQDVIEVLSEESARLTLRAVEKSDQAAVLEQRGGVAEAVIGLRDAAMVDLEAARRIRGLEPPVRRQGKRGPKPGAANGASHAPSPINAVPALPVVTNKWGG